MPRVADWLHWALRNREALTRLLFQALDRLLAPAGVR